MTYSPPDMHPQMLWSRKMLNVMQPFIQCALEHMYVCMTIIALQDINLREASSCSTAWLRGDKQPITISLHRPGHIGGWLAHMGHKKFEMSTSTHVLDNLNCLTFTSSSSNIAGNCKYIGSA